MTFYEIINELCTIKGKEWPARLQKTFKLTAKFLDEDDERVLLSDKAFLKKASEWNYKNNRGEPQTGGVKGLDLDLLREFRMLPDIADRFDKLHKYFIKRNLDEKLLKLSSSKEAIASADLSTIKTLIKLTEENEEEKKEDPKIMIVYMPKDQLYTKQLELIGKTKEYMHHYNEIRKIAYEAAKAEVKMGFIDD